MSCGMMKTGRVLAAVMVLGVGVARSQEDEEGLPSGYRFVGNYQVEKRVKVREGSPFPVAMKKLFLKVYTDGISLRVYGEADGDSYTSFTIYRNDGVLVESSPGVVETMAGLHAQSLVGDVMRQLTLTEDRLVLTKFPALSDIVEITYANRLIVLSRR
jgi:hypothetical protein